MSESTNTPVAENPIEQHLTPDASNTPEKKELRWTGGCYSRKAFRFRYICVFALTVLCAIGAWKLPIALGSSASSKVALTWGIWLIVPILLWIWVLTVAWYRSLTLKYILEEDRLICKKGLFKQTTDTILVPQMNDIQMIQTLWDRLVNGGVGTILMHTNDTTDPIIRLAGLEKPNDAFDAIDSLRKEYVRKRGIKSFGGAMLDDNGAIVVDDPGM